MSLYIVIEGNSSKITKIIALSMKFTLGTLTSKMSLSIPKSELSKYNFNYDSRIDLYYDDRIRFSGYINSIKYSRSSSEQPLQIECSSLAKDLELSTIKGKEYSKSSLSSIIEDLCKGYAINDGVNNLVDTFQIKNLTNPIDKTVDSGTTPLSIISDLAVQNRVLCYPTRAGGFRLTTGETERHNITIDDKSNITSLDITSNFTNLRNIYRVITSSKTKEVSGTLSRERPETVVNSSDDNSVDNTKFNKNIKEELKILNIALTLSDIRFDISVNDYVNFNYSEADFFFKFPMYSKYKKSLIVGEISYNYSSTGGSNTVVQLVSKTSFEG